MKVADPPPERPLLVYDGGCGFCRLTVSRWRAWMAGRVDDEPSQSAAARFPEIPASHFDRSIHLIEPDGEVRTGAAAAFAAMSRSGVQPWLWWLYRRLAFFARAAEAGYALVARNRALFSRVVRLLYGDDFERPTFRTASNLFLRLLGLVYLAAFLSLWSQVTGLAGERGILPAAELMHAAGEQRIGFAQLPTLCHWTGAGDAALHGLCGAGVVCAALLVAGLAPAFAAAGAWLLYLSLCSVVRVFLNFQWDALLLEAGFLAIFLPPLALRLRADGPAGSRLARWLLVWLLFRLMFSAGIVKLASRDESWWDLSALTYHYWTTCLPTWTCWYMDKLPLWAHKTSCFIMFAIELVAPFGLLLPRRSRLIAAASLLLLMAVIAATGNYGFFDLLAAVLCVLAIDDRTWSRLAARLRARRMPDTAGIVAPVRDRPTRFFHALAAPVLLAALALTWVPFGRVVAQVQAVCGVQQPRVPQPAWLAGVYERVAPFRSINGYGLFASMTRQRDEIVLEGSDDGVNWRAYAFTWKPGDVNRRPRFCTPHMPRLDWQMWFAALGEIRSQPWLVNTMVRLLEGEPAVLRLLASNPFPDRPPRQVRALAYGYRFTTFAERRATGAWWRRDATPRVYCPPLQLRPRAADPAADPGR